MTLKLKTNYGAFFSYWPLLPLASRYAGIFLLPHYTHRRPFMQSICNFFRKRYIAEINWARLGCNLSYMWLCKKWRCQVRQSDNTLYYFVLIPAYYWLLLLIFLGIFYSFTNELHVSFFQCLFMDEKSLIFAYWCVISVFYRECVLQYKLNVLTKHCLSYCF